MPSPNTSESPKADSCSHHPSPSTIAETSSKDLANESKPTAETECRPESSLHPLTNQPISTSTADTSGISKANIACDSQTTIQVIGAPLERCEARGDEQEVIGICRRDFLATELNECCQESSCTSISTSPQTIDDCSKNDCCSSHVVGCDSDTDKSSTSPKLFISRSQCAANSICKMDSISDLEQMDVESGAAGTGRITIQVQGMTCTGCEKKLFRLLASLPEVSLIKTSLLLAQAEFTLRPSDSVDAKNIASTLQRLTGFKCTKMTHNGEELDFIVNGDAQDYADRPWPTSVIDVFAVSKNRIRVNYHPKAIGARTLVADPYFRHAILAPPSASPLIASGRAHLWKSFCMTLFSCICTIPVLVLAWGPLPKHQMVYGAISLVLATIVQVFVGGPFYISAAKTLLFSRMVDMDLLVVLSTTPAYIYSIAAYAYLVTGKSFITGQFFETSTLLITLIMVGRTVSAYARQRAVESITIESLQTQTATILEEGNVEKEIDTRLLQYDDIFKVLADMSIVTDGVILTGESELDESLMTGEAELVHKRPGDVVVAGSINHSGTLKVCVSRLPCENTIKTIGAMVDEAKSSRPKVQDLADKVASYFVPAILLLAVVVFIAWVAVEKIVRNERTTTACITAMTYAISVLIVSCPCAIGLAVPMVVVIAGGVGARHGLIFQTAETIDKARKVSHVIFDKTGTLTRGKLEVTAQEYFTTYINVPTTFEPALILGLTTNSSHPVSKAIASHLISTGIEPLIIEHIVSHPGKGIEARWKGSSIRAGSPYWLNVQNEPAVTKLLSGGLTIFCVTIDSALIAVYGLRDSLRSDALSTITTLRSRGIEISLLSGDSDSSVHAIANQLGIAPSNVVARCTPAQKQAYVSSKLSSSTQTPKQKNNIVLFCGDGTNDAPSLARASIGVHMNSGSDIAGSAADAVLMRPSLHGIITLMDLSKAFHRRVVFNFVWCFVYNLFAVLLAAGAFVSVRGGLRIRPEFAGLGELVSVLPVVAVAVGLKFRRF